MTPISCQRHRFAIPRDVHYLNCAYMSPLSLDVQAAITAGALRKATPWTYRPSDFFTGVEALRSNAAQLAGGVADDYAIVPSASYGLAVAARNVPLAAGQEVVVLADQFPSNVYVWREKARETGAHLVTVQRDPDDDWTASVLAAIGPQTAIVAVPQCHWADGRLVDLIAVGQACRQQGAALVLDLTQSLGALPFDVRAVQPDFMVAACYKWLMGPYGTGLLYAAPRQQGGRSIEENWINREGSEDFARLVDYRDRYQPGARRFDMGEKSNPPLIQGAIAGLEMLLDWGVDAIAHTLGARTSALAAAAATLGMPSAPLAKRAPHFLALDLPASAPPDLTACLAARNVHVSQRGAALRITPHLYNHEQDCDALLEGLRACLA